MTVNIYKKGDGWTKDFTEADNPSDVWYVECPGYSVPLDISVEDLLKLRDLGCWTKYQCGMKEPYTEGEHIKCNGYSRESTTIFENSEGEEDV